MKEVFQFQILWEKTPDLKKNGPPRAWHSSAILEKCCYLITKVEF